MHIIERASELNSQPHSSVGIAGIAGGTRVMPGGTIRNHSLIDFGCHNVNNTNLASSWHES